MKGLRNCQSTPNTLKARSVIGVRHRRVSLATGRPDRHSSCFVFVYFVFSLNFFSQIRVWASSWSTGAMSKHFSFSTTLPFL